MHHEREFRFPCRFSSSRSSDSQWIATRSVQSPYLFIFRILFSPRARFFQLKAAWLIRPFYTPRVQQSALFSRSLSALFTSTTFTATHDQKRKNAPATSHLNIIKYKHGRVTRSSAIDRHFKQSRAYIVSRLFILYMIIT